MSSPVLRSVALLTLAACGDGAPRVDAPRPAMDTTVLDTAAVSDMPGLPPSRLDVPVVIDLSPVLQDLEADVPRMFGDMDERTSLSSNERIDVAWEAERSDFQAELHGDTARLTALIRYRARAWYDPPVAPELSASCGTAEDHDDRPLALVTVSSRLRLDRNWTLRSDLSVDTIRPASAASRNECRITVLRLDVTGSIMEAARNLLEKQGPAIDSAVAGVDLRSRFNEWWDLIRTPIRLSDSIWLVIDPVGIRRGAIRGDRLTLHADVGLTARPRIVVGRRPPEPVRPLPPLEDGQVDPGLHILVEGILEYPAISHILDEELAGTTFERAGRSIRITNLELSGIGNGRLALRVRFTGDAAGNVWFVGTPEYDPTTGFVSVPDLDFDVATSSLLVEGLDWLGHDGFVSWVRERARWPVDDAVAEGRRLLLEGLNRDLSESVNLSGEVDTIVPLAVFPTLTALRVHAHARASARLIAR